MVTLWNNWIFRFERYNFFFFYIKRVFLLKYIADGKNYHACPILTIIYWKRKRSSFHTDRIVKTPRFQYFHLILYNIYEGYRGKMAVVLFVRFCFYGLIWWHIGSSIKCWNWFGEKRFHFTNINKKILGIPVKKDCSSCGCGENRLKSES